MGHFKEASVCECPCVVTETDSDHRPSGAKASSPEGVRDLAARLPIKVLFLGDLLEGDVLGPRSVDRTHALKAILHDQGLDTLNDAIGIFV